MTALATRTRDDASAPLAPPRTHVVDPARPPGPLARFRERAHGPGHPDDEAQALWAAAGEATTGGRGTRPHLVRVAHASFGGTDETACAHLADAVELLHAAFVVHDDVIDQDELRRGRPNPVGTFTRRAAAVGATPGAAAGYGRAAGLLAGDLALVAAVRAFATVPAAPHVVARLGELLDDAVAQSAVGELRDVRLALRVDRPTLADALAVAELKTARYSFCLPLCAGALLAGASERELAALDRVGRLVGVAFQLRDDLLGVFGDEAATGKSTLSDLREGKETALVALARATDAWPRLAPLLGDPDLTPEGARTARDLLTRCGARAAVAALAAERLAAAHEAARGAGLPTALLSALTLDAV